MLNSNIVKAQAAVVAEFLASHSIEVNEPEILLLLANLQTGATAATIAASTQWAPSAGPMDDAQYLVGKGLYCPCCGSKAILSDGAEAEGPDATQQVNCTNCGASWADTFVLTGYSGLEGGINLETIASVVEDVRTRAKEHGFSLDNAEQAREAVETSCDLIEPSLSEAERKIAVQMLVS